MHDKQGFCSSIFNMRSGAAALAMAFAVLVFLAPSAQAQTYRVLYTFDTGPNAWAPVAGLSMDTAGNLYGTTDRGGGQGDCPPPGGCGSVFQLTYTGSGWAQALLHGFNGPYDFGRGPGSFAGTDGSYPYARAILGPDGSLYGTTSSGASGGGTVYQLTPSRGDWTQTVLHRFVGGGHDGFEPEGDVVFDQAGNLYGTTVSGGAYYYEGTVYRLAHSGSGWVYTGLYDFSGGSDGNWPYAGVIFDNLGNLYGTTGAGGAADCIYGGPNCGTVFQLTPSGSGWTKKIIHNFHDGNDVGNPSALIFDRSGNLYGTICGGPGGGGAVFMLSPSGDSWIFHVLSMLSGTSCGFQGGLTLDGAGNLYGATFSGGAYGSGTIFKLTPYGGGWWYTDLYDFTGGSDGGEPNGSLVFDRDGNLYGTTQYGGVSHYCGGAFYTGCGVVFEITP